MHSAHPNMRMQHPGVNNRDQSLAEQSSSKPANKFALPMYTVGIAIFFLYTCFKVCPQNWIRSVECERVRFSIGQNAIVKKMK